MESFTNPLHSHSLHTLILILTLLLPTVLTVTHNHKLIYNHCPNHSSLTLSHNSPVLLTELFQQFVAKSSQSKFYKTIVTDGNTAISGKFQCRNDLAPDECTNCVSKIPEFSKKSCGEALPARIQLSGCYVHYEEDRDEDNSYARPEEVHYRECSERELRRKGFEKVKYAAFSALENGVMNGDGFYETTCESIHVVAQCAASLRSCGCGECVNSAVQIVEEECRDSVSGEVYLDSCYISFKYIGGDGGYSFEGNGRGEVIAIFVGGLAALVLVVGLCSFFRSCGKKKDDW